MVRVHSIIVTAVETPVHRRIFARVAEHVSLPAAPTIIAGAIVAHDALLGAQVAAQIVKAPAKLKQRLQRLNQEGDILTH